MTTINYQEIELEADIEWGTAISCTPRGRIDWDEHCTPAVEQVLIKDGKGRKWDIAEKLDDEEIERLETEEAEDNRRDADEARMENMIDRDFY